MNLGEYAQHDALELAELVRTGQVTASELARLAYDGIEKVNPQLNAIVEIFRDRIDDLDEGRLPDGPLRGVPLLMKDLGPTIKGRRQTCGSRLTKDFVPDRDSEITARFKKAGLNIIGTTTAPEQGYTWTTESVIHGKTRNPWNMERIAGGSSGGSAALTAAGVVPMAHANDGGGSTRLPASINGLVGLKCSRGRTSYAPEGNDILFPLFSDLVVSRTVRDTAAALDALEGPAPGEGVPVARPDRPYLEEVDAPVGKLRIALSNMPWGSFAPDPDVKAQIDKVGELLESMGHQVVEAIPNIDFDVFHETFAKTFQLPAQALLDWVAEEVGSEVREENLEPVLWKVYCASKGFSAKDYIDNTAQLNMVSRKLADFFTTHDLLLTPTQAIPTPNLDMYHLNFPDKSVESYFSELWRAIPYTPICNATGVPAISLPLCHTSDGMPLGAHFIAPLGEEALLIRLAADLEQAAPWIDRRPGIHVSAI